MTVDLAEVGRLVATQDNACTAEPLFVVQRKRRITGFDTKWCEDSVVWINEYQSEEVDSAEAAKLEAEYQETGEEPEGRTRTGYLDIWEFVTACFTRAAAERFIAENKHNLLPEARVYVESAHRNHEMIAIRAHLRGLAKEAA